MNNPYSRMEVVNQKPLKLHRVLQPQNRRLLLLVLLFLLTQIYLVSHDSGHFISEHEDYGCELCLIAGGMDLANVPSSIDSGFYGCPLVLFVTTAGVFSVLFFSSYLTRAPPLRYQS